MRPLISTGDPKKSVDISRKAELYETSSGMVTITGGKLTTWRRMAKMTVDRIVERDGRDAPCRTHEIPLGMAVDAGRPAARRRRRARRPTQQLAGRYGHVAHDVLRVARERGELAEPIVPGRARPAGRGRLRRPARAGAHGRGRAAAPHAARRCWRPAHCARDGPARRPRRGAMAAELGWDAPRRGGAARGLARRGRAEGVAPAARNFPAAP